MKTFKFTQYSLLGRSSIFRPSLAGSQVVNLLYLWRNLSVKRFVAFLLLTTTISIFYYTCHLNSPLHGFLTRKRVYLTPSIQCSHPNRRPHLYTVEHNHRWSAGLRIDPKVLVLVETTYSKLGREIAELLVHNRIKYRLDVAGKSLPVLTNLDKGKFGVIVFENYNKYLHMDKWNRELLDKYCREYRVGIVGFIPATEHGISEPLRGFPLTIRTRLQLKDATLNAASKVLRLTRAGETVWGTLPGDDWSVFESNHSTYEPLSWARNLTDSAYENEKLSLLTTVIQFAVKWQQELTAVCRELDESFVYYY